MSVAIAVCVSKLSRASTFFPVSHFVLLTVNLSDALSRHLRRCTVAQRDIETAKKFQSIGSKKQIRDKRACDHCANLKLKCALQHPCDECRRKSLTCTYTRNGYVDPYEGFRVEKEKGRHQSDVACKRFRPSHMADLQLDAPQAIPEDAQGETLSFRLSQKTAASPAASRMADLSSLAYSEMETSCLTSEQVSNDWLSMDFSPADFDIVTHPTFPFASVFDTNPSSICLDLTQQADPLISENWAYALGEGMDILFDVRVSPLIPYAKPGLVQELEMASKLPPPPPTDGFTLRQLDPVEAKCTEIRALLHGIEPLIHRDDIGNYITRENVLMCGQLFGRHLSRNIPIVHSPTFMLTEAPPMLLLAVTLGGACYSNNAIRAECITKFAMGLLILIERQTVRSPLAQREASITLTFYSTR